ncbi:malate synthase [Silvimonas terrae]|uniref:malate synthase n=1 Tax=Silvimonas terrae TaxID=300266 RepID=A0A840RFB7_9NEIS|nr:malate synthase [Silvimonas terrae]MBB5190941.1 malate synthase [Silvimonas terrae]
MASHANCALENRVTDPFVDVLTPAALQFIAALHREFAPARQQVLQGRKAAAELRLQGDGFEFPDAGISIREDLAWRVPPAPPDLQDRRVEIASPADNRKVVINALNAGAQVWIADLEDAMSPTWNNAMSSQRNLRDAIHGTLAYEDTQGKRYQVQGDIPAIMVRPRGWHLPEKHLHVDGQETSASLVDFGLYMFHCAKAQLDRGSGPYFYLPKLESQADARLWHNIFNFAEHQLSLPQGSIRATVIIEHIGAAFQMQEILHALGPHATGLTAGRWDYLFSIARAFRLQADLVLPDRAELTMDRPFLQAYTRLLIQTCHQRGAHAIGGVATQIPDRHDEAARTRAVTAVRLDKEHEAQEGFDGTWVIHPDLVPVCHAAWAPVLADRPNQINQSPAAITIHATDLWNGQAIPGHVTEPGLRASIAVSVSIWMAGCVATARSNCLD